MTQQRTAALTVLYDASCPLCRWAREWLGGQAQLVPLHFLAAGSPEARRRFPQLDPARTLREVTVVDDRGAVYVGERAWVTCLWALVDHRPMAERLSHPAMLPFARAAVAAVSRYRTQDAQGRHERPAGYGEDCGTSCA